MSERPARLRAVIALEPGYDAESALQAALSFAAGMEPELFGLFVEDENLLRVAGLPAVGEVMLSTGAFRRVERGQLEKQLRAQAREIQRRFEHGARNRHIRFVFQATRGEPVAEVSRAAESADVLIVTMTRSSSSPLACGKPSLSALTRSTRRPIMFVQPAWNTGRRVMTLASDSQRGDATLDVARRIAGSEHLELLVVAQEAAEAKALRERLAPSNCTIRIASSGIETLCRLVRQEDVRVVVLPRDLPGLDVDAVRQLLDTCRASLVLV